MWQVGLYRKAVNKVDWHFYSIMYPFALEYFSEIAFGSLTRI